MRSREEDRAPGGRSLSRVQPRPEKGQQWRTLSRWRFWQEVYSVSRNRDKAPAGLIRKIDLDLEWRLWGVAGLRPERVS